MSSELVRLTTVADEFAAETIIGLLQTEGIESIQRKTDFAAGMADASASAFGPRTAVPHRRVGPLAPTPDRCEAAVKKRRLNLTKVEDRPPHPSQNPYEVIDAGLQ